MQEIRKLSVGGESPYDKVTVHYQVGSYTGKNSPFKIYRIRKDGRLFQASGKSEYDIFVENENTQEVFQWKRACVGDSKNHWEEFNLDFE